MTFPTTLPAANGDGKLLPQTLADRIPDSTREVFFRVCLPDTPQPFPGEQAICDAVAAANPMIPQPLFLVDNDLFSPDRTDYCMTLDTVEEWTIYNTLAPEHPFHIHTNAFEVLSINGVPLDPPRWLDTVTIPGAYVDEEGVYRPGSVTLRSELVDFAGKMLLHCHLLAHEETGMMQLLEIVEPDEPLPANCPQP